MPLIVPRFSPVSSAARRSNARTPSS